MPLTDIPIIEPSSGWVFLLLLSLVIFFFFFTQSKEGDIS